MNNNSAMNNAASTVNNIANTAVSKTNRAANKIAQIGTIAKNLGSTRETLDISWNTIGIITLLGAVYMVAASVGINTFTKCGKFKGKSLHENLNNVLVASLGIALAIPFTLTMTKMFSNEMPVFMMTYAIMGVIGASIALNWAVNCKDVDKNTTPTIGVSLASFIATLLFGVFLIIPKGKVNV
jgi:hypothetical protein